MYTDREKNHRVKYRKLELFNIKRGVIKGDGEINFRGKLGEHDGCKPSEENILRKKARSFVSKDAGWLT